MSMNVASMPELLHHLVEDAERAAVDVVADEHVIARS